jgi:hypothetical protein
LRAPETQRILLVQVTIVDAAGGAQGVEDLVVLLKAVEIAFQQKLVVIDGSLHPEPDQAVRMGVGEGTKQDAVDDAEDGGDAADTQRHREHGDPEMGGCAAETSQRVTEVLKKRFEPDPHAGFRHRPAWDCSTARSGWV